MYRGTTPTIIFHVKSNLDLKTMKQIWVTFKSVISEKTYEINELVINSEEKTITVEMSQEDTLKFYNGVVKTQIRFLDEYNRAYASNIKELELNNILKEGVIYE